MSLSDLLQKPVNKKDGKVNEEITKERILENLDKYRELIAYWRFYPDRFVDYLCSLNPDNTFQLYFYQRLFLRAIFRHRYIYATFVRAWSKSFMSVLANCLQCVLYPGAKIFTVAGGKRFATLS